MAQEMCKIHPDKEIIDVCVHCGRSVCVACAATLAGKTYCLECIKVIDASAAGQTKDVLWENRVEAGFFKALFTTWANLLLHPKKFFQNMPTKTGMKNPLLFALIWGSLAVIVSALINMAVVLSGAALPSLPQGAPIPPRPALVGSYVVLMILSPLLVLAGIFIISAIYHLVVLIFGGRQGFLATFRVLSYANALAVFNIIPILGPVFVTIYSIVLFIIGFKRVHKMGTARAVMAALLPMLVLFLIGFAAAFYLASQQALPQPAAGAMPSVTPPITPPANPGQ